MMRKLYIAFILYMTGATASGQSTFTTYLNSFTYQSTQILFAPRALLQLPDSSFRLLTKHKSSSISSYVNTVARITKKGQFDTAFLIQAPLCYQGFIPKPALEFKDNFIYFDVPDNCSGNLLSKLDSNGKDVWQKDLGWYVQRLQTISDTMIGATSLSGDFYVFNTDGSILKQTQNLPIFQITGNATNGYYASTYSNTFVRLNSDFSVIRQKHDSTTNVQLTGTNNEFCVTSDKKIVALYTNKTIHTPSGWNQYYIAVFDTLFNAVIKDSISMSNNTASASFVRELADGNYLVICPSEDGFVKFMKLNKNLEVMYDFKLTTQLLFKYFDTYPLKMYARTCVKTLDGGFLLAINFEAGPYDHTTFLVKFDSLGNFYWPFATGRKELSNILHSVYPNPATDKLYFELNEPGQHTLTITDASGQVIHQNIVMDKAEIETSHWSGGVYFYHLNSGSKTSTGKFVKM